LCKEAVEFTHEESSFEAAMNAVRGQQMATQRTDVVLGI